MTGYPYWQLTKSHEFHQNSSTILMFPGYICTRKGADYVEDIVRYLNDNFSHFKLKLVGFLAYSKWKTIFRNLERKYPENFAFLEGRVDFGSPEWRALATNVAFAIFPSHEEGLAGCALDVMNLGIPLIHSSKSGIEYQHELLHEVDFENDYWREGLTRIIQGGRSLWKDISDKQRKAAFHLQPRYSAVGRSLGRIANGRIWPNIDTSLFPELAKGLSFVNNPKLPYEYRITANQSPEIQYRYLNMELESKETLLIAALLLEKYTRFDSINLANLGQDNLCLVRNIHEKAATRSRDHIELMIKEYVPTSSWPTDAIFYLRIRETIITFFSKKIYQTKRGIKILRQKMGIEINRLITRLDQ